MTLILVILLLALALIACGGLLYFLEETEPGGLLAAFVAGFLLILTLNAMDDYKALKVQAADYGHMVEQRDSALNKYDTLALKTNVLSKNYRGVQEVLAKSELERLALVDTNESLEEALNEAQNDALLTRTATDLCEAALAMANAKTSELEEDLRVSQGQLTTVRNLIRGN